MLANKFRTIIIMIAVLVVTVVSSAYADEITIPESIPNWYPTETSQEMMSILIDEFDLTVEGAAAVIGNICQESMFNANASNGYNIGICQWDPSRWSMITSWITENNYEVDDPYAQLRAAFSSAENGSYDETIKYMKSVTSISDGVHRFIVFYEGAAGQQESERNTYAQYAYDLYNANL